MIRQRAAVVATFVSHGLLFASWTAHIPLLKAQLGLSDATLGLILLATPVGSVLAIGLTGRLLSRFGSQQVVRGCLLGYYATGPLVGLADSSAELAGALLAWGAFQGSLDVAMNTQAVAVQRAQRRHLMPGFHGGWSIGSFAGAGLGTLAVALGVSLTPQLLVLGLPIIGAAAVLSVSLISDDHVSSAAPGAHLREPLPPAVLLLGGVAFACMLCEGAAADWSAVYLRGPAHLTASLAGLGYASFALAMTATRLGGERLLARVSVPRLLPALAGVASAGMADALLTGSAVPGLIGFACLGLGTGLIVPTVFTAAAQMPGVTPGRGIAAVSGLGWAGFVCGPPAIGQLAGSVGLRTALAVLPLLMVVIAGVMARMPSLQSAPVPGDFARGG